MHLQVLLMSLVSVVMLF